MAKNKSLARKIGEWWGGLSTPLKIVTGLFVAALLVLIGVVSFFLIFARRDDTGGGSIVDVVAAARERETAKREGKLVELSEHGKKLEEAADRELEELKDAGNEAQQKREDRHEQIDGVDSWSDLDAELGEPRSNGRQGKRLD